MSGFKWANLTDKKICKFSNIALEFFSEADFFGFCTLKNVEYQLCQIVILVLKWNNLTEKNMKKFGSFIVKFISESKTFETLH